MQRGTNADRHRGTGHHNPPYRGDIDGLRALSVMAVILFHLVPTRFPAGGLGVDVFFVISGYLVGGSVLRDLASGTFDFRNFYLRRVRRIAPAFLFMLLAVSAAAWIWLYPAELTGFATSTLAALFCVSNFYFAAHSGYFDPNSELLPLLHTWTLGVEEQFYFLFPFVGFAAVRLGRRARARTTVIAALALASLALSQHQVDADGPAAFYLLPSRGWELLVGVLAYRAPSRLFTAAWQRASCCAVGIGLVLLSFWIIDPSAGFPGLKAVPPCLGTAMVLASGAGGASSVVHRALTLQPLRMIGLASYSLYIWHWPIIVFWKYHALAGKLRGPALVMLLILILFAGFASWYFIERPFRRHTMRPRRLLAVMAALAVLVAAIQGAGLATGGAPFRYGTRALAISGHGTARGIVEPAAHCFLQPYERIAAFDRARCLDNRAGAPDWLLLGDSHAAMLYHGLHTGFPAITLHAAVGHGCDLRLHARRTGQMCDDLAHLVFASYLPRARITGMIVTGRSEALHPDELSELGGRLRAAGARLVVIGPAPGYTMPVSRILAEAVDSGDEALTAKLVEPRIWDADAALRAAAAGGAFTYVSPLAILCPGRRFCRIANGRGLPLYFDGDHYTPEGSRLVVGAMTRAGAFDGVPLGHGR